MPTWREHKANLKAGHLTLDLALHDPELADRALIEVLALAALAPPAQRNHDQAANFAETVLDSCHLNPATNIGHLSPPQARSILTHALTHPPEPL